LYILLYKKGDGLMNTFICYERCTTCKKAQKWLDIKGVEYKVRPIKEKNPTAAELTKWIKKSGKEARKFFNTSGQLYREMGLSKKLPDMSEDEMLRLLASDGMLVKRPLLVTGDKVLVGFREEDWRKAL
jgi:arsenate reductase